ncbi:MAG: non-homologous end-joining DNA ligase [Actinomycetota bacterium]|nr:non-homologous end-joining DNA ligase [Actinomycetota bacterium]
MLATLTEPRSLGPGWVYEHKLDGVRCLAFRDGAKVQLLSRNRLSMTQTYPEIADALAKQAAKDFIIDGEIVAFDGDRTSFERLQQRIGLRDELRSRLSDVRVYLYAFDALWLAGEDARAKPLTERKALLKKAFSWRSPLRYSAHKTGDALTLHAQACSDGLEGLIAKRSAAPYRSGRSADWLKLKCVNEQEFVIGGYTDPKGSRNDFGALLIGYFDDGRLRYAGEVGTGFTHATLERIGTKLRTLETTKSPFADFFKSKKGVHWVRPKLVGQVGFTEWTRDGRLRHPRFLGLRTDKKPTEVLRERPRS